MSNSDPVVKLAAAIEKCLTDLAAAVGEFREGYRPMKVPTVTVIREPVFAPVQAPPKEWLTTHEAADHMGYKIETLYMWARTGLKGPRAYGKGKDRRYMRSECDAWLKRSPRETTDTLKIVEGQNELSTHATLDHSVGLTT